jgi:cytochrome P450
VTRSVPGPSNGSASALSHSIDRTIVNRTDGQLTFGHGDHASVGMGQARLEGAAAFASLVERVETIEFDGLVVRKRNNLIWWSARFP